jgi:hypothetical protein
MIFAGPAGASINHFRTQLKTDMKTTEQLRRDGAGPFVKSWKGPMIWIESKAQAVRAGGELRTTDGLAQ